VSQQQLVPEPQDESANGSQENAEIDRHLYKSARTRSSDMPKEEHPSTFEETIPPYSYHAQDRVTQNLTDPAHSAHFHETNARERQSRRRRFSPDGDALENGYRPYQQQQYHQVPPWARPQPQRNSHILRWLVLIVMTILFIKPLLVLLGALFLTGVTVLGLIILIPLIILGVLILVGVVLAILGIVLGRAVWRGIWH
jgi:membrane glycosyltransferase